MALIPTPKHDTTLPSYVNEVKDLKADATEADVQKAVKSTKEQAERYA